VWEGCPCPGGCYLQDKRPKETPLYKPFSWAEFLKLQRENKVGMDIPATEKSQEHDLAAVKTTDAYWPRTQSERMHKHV